MDMNNKVYTIKLDWAYKGESDSELLGTYKDFDTAKIELKKIVEKEKAEWDEDDDSVIIYEGEDYWEAYADGRYESHHTTINIVESELI